MFIEFMVRLHGVLDFEMLQQNARGAGVFGQNQIGLLQDADGPECHVLQIAYRRRYDV